MAALKLVPEPSSALERLCERLARLEARPRAILGCTYPFDGSIFAEILDRVAEAMRLEDDDLARIPIDVVCDRALYRGHPWDRRYRVHLYDGERLFHPKLLIVLFDDQVLWLSGSANLTRSGLCSNREIVLLHEPESTHLPAALRRLLTKLPGDAAPAMHAATSDAGGRSFAQGRFVSSLDGPIGPRFLDAKLGVVEEVHVLAPFFEKVARPDTVDDGWLSRLHARFPDAAYRFYVPLLEAGRRPCVQGERALFERFAERLADDRRLRFIPVEANPGPLHAKLVAAVYRNGAGRRARILVGSPNATRRALLDKNGNVEVAWLTDVAAAALHGFLGGLTHRAALSLSALRWEAPDRSADEQWAALTRAELDVSRKRLTLTWSDDHGPGDTHVIYAGRRLVLSRGRLVDDFELDGEHASLETRPMPRRRGVISGHCPIEVPLVDHILLDALQRPMSPEDWLQQLGAERGQRGPGPGGRQRGKNRSATPARTTVFAPSGQVRDLAARLRYALGCFQQPFRSRADRDALFETLRRIFEAHDPAAPGLAETHRVWHGWVRAELALFAASAAGDASVRAQGHQSELRRLARELRHDLDLGGLPPGVRKQLRQIAGPAR